MENQRINRGVWEVDVGAYPEFAKYVDSLSGRYVFRGQACDWWELRPSLAHFFGESEYEITPLHAYTLTKKFFPAFEKGCANALIQCLFSEGVTRVKLPHSLYGVRTSFHA